LQLATISDCVGIGVATPFPPLVGVIVVGSGVLTADGTKALKDVGNATVFDKEIAVVEDMKPVDCSVGIIVLGAGSSSASTQYDFPTVRFPQSAVMLGFYAFH
jgi:hypothetical protein